MQNHVNKARRTAEDLAQEALDGVKGRVTDLVDEAADRGEEFLNKAKERGGEWLDEAQDRGADGLESAQKWIRKNPGSAVGYAFIAGAILYALFRNRD